MNNEMRMRKRQMLEALEFIDDDLISGVLKKIKPELEIAEPVRTWRTPFKHWKQFVALAASLILLSLAFPVITRFVSNTIDFLAGRGGDNTDDTEGMYDEYILTEEDLAEINKAYFDKHILPDLIYAELDEAFIEEHRNNNLCKFAVNVEHAMERSTRPSRHFYFGKYSDCIVITKNVGADVSHSFMHQSQYDLGEYTFTYAGAHMFVFHDSKMYEIDIAYEMGLLDDSDVEKLYQFYVQYYKGDNSN